MAGSVSFPITVEIAFGSGPMDTTGLTWTDISAYVRKSGTVNLSRGYDAEADQPLAGRASFSVNNDDGRFTPSKSSGPYGLVRNKLPVRVKRGSTVLWTGVIEKLAMSYDNGMRPIVNVTCVDRWARLQTRQFTSDRVTPAIVASGATHLWPFTDESGSTRAKDVIGTSDFVPTKLSGYTFQLASNPQAGNTDTVISSAIQETIPVDSVAGSSATALSFSAWLNNAWVQWWYPDPTYPDLGWVQLVYLSTGTYSSVSDSATAAPQFLSFNAGAYVSGWHNVTLTASKSGSTWTWRHYVDGVLKNTATNTIAFTNFKYMTIFGTGMAYAATWEKTLSATEIVNMVSAGIPGLLSGDTADSRAKRIQAINGNWTLTTQGTFTSTMSGPAWTGKTVGATLVECADAERGTLYLDKDGWPVLQARSYRTASALAATIPAKVLASDAQWELDDQKLCNVVQVQRMAIDVTVTTIDRRNETSIDLYDEATKSLQLWLDTDAQTIERANAEVNMTATPFARSNSFTVDLATCQTDFSEATALGIDISSRITISGLPSTAPVPTAAGWYVESIEDTITHTNWKRTFTVTPALDFWTLEDAVYGALDSTFVLAY